MHTVILRLTPIVILLVVASLVVERIRNTAPFQRLGSRGGHLAIGVVFGLIAVGATLFGVDIDGAVINVRDAAPICAGLFFGAPAGMIVGFIGGIHRFLWSAGDYTRLACALSTIFAGFWAAGIRLWMFDDKRPKWYYGFAIGVLVEILHMLMIILTHMQDIHIAFGVVKACTLPMTLSNGLAVMLAAGVLSLKRRDTQRKRQDLEKITHSFGRWLMSVVLAAFAITTAFSWSVETQLSVTDAVSLLKLNMRDVRQDIVDASDENLLRLAREVAEELNPIPVFTKANLSEMLEKYDIAEINVVDQRGTILISTQDAFHNYNMADGEQSAEFMALLDGETEAMVQSYQPISYDRRISRKYAGVTLARGGFVQVGYDAQAFQRDIASQVVGATKNRHIGDSGFIVIADENGTIVSDRNGSAGRMLSEIGLHRNVPEGELFRCQVYGEESFCIHASSEGYSVIAAIPREEVMLSRDVSLYLAVFREAVIFAALYVLIYHLIKTRIVDNIQRINRSLAEITDGDLDVVVDVRSNEEFASLSDDINATVVTLKRYIDEAAARIDQELEFARTIQHSALPSVFPPFPARDEIDLYAQMDTAKEVGGDFYDFYFVDSDHLAFLIADVSGKGIPAAMFMMTAKTLLKGFAEAGREVQDIFTLTNEKLCERNEANMFVTAWMGILDLRTGMVEYANAGHNPPLVKHQDGSFEYLRSRPGLVLAGMDGIRYRKNTLQLAPGDVLFLYTDGVTEANDEAGALYGEARLSALLNGMEDGSAQQRCEGVKRDLDAFAGNAPQFDDITMLCMKIVRYSEDREGRADE